MFVGEELKRIRLSLSSDTGGSLLRDLHGLLLGLGLALGGGRLLSLLGSLGRALGILGDPGRGREKRI